MSNFWEKMETIETTGSFESSAGFDPLPDGTQVVAVVDDAGWDSYEDGPIYINLKWEIIDGEYKGRKIYQKVRVNDDDAKKAEKNQRMFLAIAKNAGGGLLKIGREPTDQELCGHLTNKPMALRLGVWEINGKSGNWVQAVAPVGGAAQEAKANVQQEPDFSISKPGTINNLDRASF